MRVNSAVDIWSEALIFSSIAFLTAAFLYLTVGAGFPPQQIFIALAAVLAASSFLLWLLFGTYYELRRNYLYCKSGPFVERIRYDDIRYLELCSNISTSLALSTRRIEIHQYDDGLIIDTMISPKNRKLFLAQLRDRCQHLDNVS